MKTKNIVEIEVDEDVMNRYEHCCFVSDDVELVRDCKSKEELQAVFWRAAFGGERVLAHLNGAEVAIVPMEDYAVLEAMDREFFNSLEQK
jgi:hypothetical protein